MATSKQLAARKRTGKQAAAERNPKGKGAKRSRIVQPRKRPSILLHNAARLKRYWEDRQVRVEAELGLVVAKSHGKLPRR